MRKLILILASCLVSLTALADHVLPWTKAIKLSASSQEAKAMRAYTAAPNGVLPVELSECGFKREREILGGQPLSWLALEGGSPDTSAGRCSPTPHRVRGFLSAGGDALHAGSIPSVVSSPFACSLFD
jgi:hypothetical protein